MGKRPLFSIILPTRNRSKVIEEAIKSVIIQKFQDWELIIVDNNISDDTFLVVFPYLNEKIRYIRTGELAMHENWQRGIDQARGTYVTVLQDKATYAPNALEQVFRLIETVPDVQMIVMGYVANDKSFPYPKIEKPPIYSFTSTEVLQLELYERYSEIDPILPKMIISWCHRSVIDWCKTQNESFFQPFSPDFSAMYIQLSYFERLHYIEAPLIHFDTQYSTGEKFTHKKYNDETAQDFLRLSTGGSLDPLYTYSKVGVRTLYNAIMNDYEHIRMKFPNRLMHHPMSIVQVYKEAINQIYDCERIGIDMSDERQSLSQELQTLPKFISNLIINHERMINSTYLKGPHEFASHFIIEIMRAYLTKGEKIAIWGAGDITKFILLKLGKEADLVECIVDINEQKHGQLLGPYEIQISPTKELLNRNIDMILIATQEWQKEVEVQIQSMGLRCKILSSSRIKDFLVFN